jgi:hypothetical protein
MRKRTKVWFPSLKERNQSEVIGIDGRRGICGGRVWIGFIWLRLGTSDWLF